MKIRLLAVGSRPDDWVRAAYQAYSERLPREIRLELVEIPLATRSSGGDPVVAKEKESQRLLQRLRPSDFVVALDERGRQWTSRELAAQLDRWQQLHPTVCLIIGGPGGLTAPVRERADATWSLSALTLPHGLVRVVVAEQLYRAWSILKNHPYHKD